MKEEDKIFSKCGKDNHFTVPENYFDNLTNEIMSKLPEKEPTAMEKEISIWDKVRPWLYMAAMFIAILLPIRFMINQTTAKEGEITAATDAGNNEILIDDDDYVDVIMNYTMMDDYTLYQYLTSTDADLLYN